MNQRVIYSCSKTYIVLHFHNMTMVVETFRQRLESTEKVLEPVPIVGSLIGVVDDPQFLHSLFFSFKLSF